MATEQVPPGQVPPGQVPPGQLPSERTPGRVPGERMPERVAGEPAGPSDPAHGVRSLDPTRQRDQPALTTSTGLVWLVVGGIFVAISLAVLVPMATLPQGGVAIAAAVVIALLYAGMVVARLALPPGRRRLGLMATGMLLIAAVALVGTLIVAFATAESVAG